MALPNDKRDVLSHTYDIQNTIESLRQTIRQGGSLAEMDFKLASIDMSVTGFKEYLSKTIEPEYYAERRNQDSTVAAKVFSIPELFEFVAQNLEIVDLMGCYGVCRTWKDIIENSRKLQILLFLRPDPESKIVACRLPKSTSQVKFTCRLSGHNNVLRVAGSIGKWDCSKQAALPVIGSRWRSMLIAQPPIRNATFSLRCLCYYGAGYCVVGGCSRFDPPHVEFESEKGVTVGDIYDEAERQFEAHKGCPRGSIAMCYVHNDTRQRSIEDQAA